MEETLPKTAFRETNDQRRTECLACAGTAEKDSRQGIPRKDQGGQDLFPDSHRAVAITDWLQQGPYPFIANHSTQSRQQIK
jgi:hypothetical protein